VHRLARFVVAAAVFGLPSSALAQSPPPAPESIAVGDWQLTPLLQVRTRAEYRHDPPELGGADLIGRDSPRVRDAWGVVNRARLGLGAERGALKAQVTLQDARAWGAPPPAAVLAGASGAFGVYEAYFEAHTSSARPAYIRVGRQAFQWGEGRLVGMADWSHAGRSFDAIRGHVWLGPLELDALASIIDTPRPLGAAAGDAAGPSLAGAQLHGLQLAWPIDPLLRVELSGLMRYTRSAGLPLDGSRFAAARISGELYTASLRVSGDAKGWKYGAQGVVQAGTSTSLALSGADVEAFAFAGHVARTFEGMTWTPTLRLGGSFASGDDGSNRAKYTQFDPLFADPHVWHGAMDLFAWSNQIEGHARLSAVPWADTVLALEYRHARLVESKGEWIGSYLTAIGREAQSPENELGNEFDLTFAWRPWTPFELATGYSYLRLGDGARWVLSGMRRAQAMPDGSFGPARNSHFAYLQGTLTLP
jgi:hypothetical protein